MAIREFSSGGIVVKVEDKKKRILLIEDSYGRWTWPKGKINKGETPEQAAIREIGEETGLKNIEIIESLGKIEYFYRLKGKLIFKTVYLYLFSHNDKEKLKVLHEEIQDAKWFSAEEAVSKVRYKGAKEILEKAIKFTF